MSTSKVESIINAINQLTPNELVEVQAHLDSDTQQEWTALSILNTRLDIAKKLSEISLDRSSIYTTEDIQKIIGLVIGLDDNG